ncbi:MAG: dihydroxyacetone kinase subunit DhaK [Mycobacterium sp.]
MLLLVNNYTGDRMAFEMAQEVATDEGIEAQLLFINDDVAVEDSTYTVGRRGVAGNFFVIKAVGAAAEQGLSLDAVRAIGERVNANTRSLGVALTACSPPAKGAPLFELADDEIEFGVAPTSPSNPGRRLR